MTTYIDTSILVKGYIDESNSPDAIAILEENGFPIVYSHIHQIEIPNAIRLKQFRKEITETEVRAAIRDFQGDVDSGRLVRPDYDLGEIFNRAELLSTLYSGGIGSRSLDVLHVAAALESGCTQFASFDVKQRTIAASAGLTVIPEK